MPTIGEFNFGVGIDWTRFDREIQSAPQRLAQAERSMVIRPTVDTRALQQFEQQATRLQQRIANFTIRPTVDTKNAQQSFQVFERMEAKARELESRPIRVSVTSNAAEINRDFDRMAAGARAVGQVGFRIRASIDGGKETEGEIEGLNAALRGVKANERLSIAVDVRDADHANQVLQRTNRELAAARTRGANVALDINTTGIGVPQSQREALTRAALGGAARGVLQGTGVGQGAILGAGFGAAAVAAAGATAAVAEFVQAVGGATAAGIQYNANLQDTVNAYEVYTKSTESAAAAIQNLRRLAAISRATEPQTLAAGQQFLATTGGDTARAQELVRLTVLLSEARPNLPFERISQAMQQLTSGDFRAFEDGANVAFGTVNQLVKQGYTGMELYRKAVEAAGGSEELLEKNAKNFNAQLTTLTSTAARLNAAFGRGLFEQVTQGLTALNNIISAGGTAWDDYAEKVGRALGAVASAPFKGLPGAGTIGTQAASLANAAAVAAKAASDRDKALAAGTTPGTPREVARAQLNVAIDEQSGKLAQQKTLLEQLERQLHANAAAAARVTQEYQTQITPLQNQLARLQLPLPGVEAPLRQARLGSANAALRLEQAQPDVNVRAEVAGAEVVLQHEQAILDIKHRRAEMAEQLGQIEQGIAQKTAEISIRAAERELAAKQERFRGAQEARQDALTEAREGARGSQEGRADDINLLRERARDAQEARRAELEGLRDAATARQEASRDSIDALRDQITAQQDARASARETIQDEISLRNEQRQAARDTFQEIADAAREAYRQEREAADDANREFQDGLRDRIEALQDADREAGRRAQRQSAAERELAAFDKSERDRSRAESLNDARQAIGRARTGSQFREAVDRFRDIQRQQAADEKREQLEERIRKEKEAEERASLQRQDQIRNLERQARDAQRAFDQEQREQDRAFQQDERARQQEERAQARADREQDRADKVTLRQLELEDRAARKTEQAELLAAQREAHDQEVRDRRELIELERSNRGLDTGDQDAIRAAEKSDREQTRAENAAIREQEQADRIQTRAENAEIRAEQEQIAQRRQEIADAAAQIDLANDQARLERLKEQFALEEARLKLRERLEAATNVPALAQATAGQVLADNVLKLAEGVKAVQDAVTAIASLDIETRIANLQVQMQEALAPIEARSLEIQAQVAQAKSDIDVIEQRMQDLRREASELMSGGGAVAETGDSGEASMNPIQRAQAMAGNVVKGIVDFFTSDQSAANGFNKLVMDMMGAGEAAAETQSPSKRTERMAADIAAGIWGENGLPAQQQAVNDALTSLIQGMWIAGAGQADLVITEIVDRFGGSSESSLPPKIVATGPAVGAALGQAMQDGWANGGYQGVDAVLEEISRRFARVDEYIDTPEARRAVGIGIQNLFGGPVVGQAFQVVNQYFETYGWNAASKWIDGFNQSIAQQFRGPAVSGGGGGGQINSSGGVGSSAYGPASPTGGGGSGSGVKPGQEDLDYYLVVQKGYDLGSQEYRDEFNRLVNDIYNKGLLPPSDMPVTGRAFGGMIGRGGMARINENPWSPGEIWKGRDGSQYLLSNKNASIIPLDSGAAAGGSTAAGAMGTGPVSVNLIIGKDAISITGGDALGIDHPVLQEFATEIFGSFSEMMLAHSKYAPTRSDRTAAGGR